MVLLIITVYLNCIVYLYAPQLEYDAPIWDPHLIKYTNILENVQKFAIKLCLKQWDLG